MSLISSLIIPLIVVGIVFYGAYKKINVYDVFIEGAKESFDMILGIFPNLLAMILSINIFLKSNILNSIISFIKPVLKILNIPFQILPMALIRPISGSSSLAFLNNIFQEFGPDSFLGRLGSVIQGSTDTTFYVLTLYFGCVGIKKIKYALWAGLCADVIGIVSSILIVNFLF